MLLKSSPVRNWRKLINWYRYFTVLIIFQFIVANGASRTAEVAARFTLDSLPGKQMSIDADLNQRIISEKDAQAKRKN